jgi:hypothetical protein
MQMLGLVLFPRKLGFTGFCGVQKSEFLTSIPKLSVVKGHLEKQKTWSTTVRIKYSKEGLLET